MTNSHIGKWWAAKRTFAFWVNGDQIDPSDHELICDAIDARATAVAS